MTEIEGRQPVLELLRSGHEIKKILVAKGQQQGSIREILSLAEKQKVAVEEVNRRYLDKISQTHNHQGVIAQISQIEYYELDDLLAQTPDAQWPPFYVLLDGVQDPHNLGSVLRSGEAANIHGVIIPKRRAVGLTPAVFKSSAGAASYVPVCQVANIANTIDRLKEHGVWVVGADMGGEVCYEQDLRGPIALVIGGEGRGLSRLVKEKCDFLSSIPMQGQINSLNAAVAGALLMFEIVRQRVHG